MAEAGPKGFGISLAVAVVAVFIGVAAIAAVGLTYNGANSQLGNEVTSLQSQVSSLSSQANAQPNSLQVVNQPVQTRRLLVEWEATLPSLQDRWLPQMIVVNQGDSIILTVESNDTDGAHTFTMLAPTGPNGALQETQLNVSAMGQWAYFPPRQSGPMFGTELKGSATNCITMDQNVTCNTTGGCSINGAPIGPCTGSWMLGHNQTEIASVQASVTFGPFRSPGVYRYFCVYHQDIGMVGYLLVLPNKAYNPSA